jgi:hypothetical protein
MEAEDEGVPGGVGHAERVTDGRDDERRVPDRGQIHEGDAAGEIGAEALRCPNREPGLADTAGSGQGHQPHFGSPEERLELRDLLLPPHQ